MSRKPEYYSTVKNNYQNRLDIGKDSVKAKEIGISYGQYKAGIMPDDSPSEYAVSSSDYIKRSEKKEPEVKAAASIRIR